MERARFGLAAMSLGAMKRCLQICTRYADRRTVHTGRLLDNPVVLSDLADIIGATAALECLVRTTATQLDSAHQVPTEIFIACKITGPEMLWKTADVALQICGGRGFIETNVISQILRDSRVLRIFEGPTQTLEVYLGALALSEKSVLPQILDALSKSKQLSNRVAADLISLQEACVRDEQESPILHRQKAGRLANAAIILAVSINDPAACNWAEENYAQILRSGLIRHELTYIIPSSESVSDVVKGYRSGIGDIEQTLPGEDHSMDSWLRREWHQPEN